MIQKWISINKFVFWFVVVIVASVWFFGRGVSGGVENKIFPGELFQVQRGGFDISVPASGELAAEKQINIHNHLESGATIIELVDEGTRVSDGDVLMQLNDEQIKESIRDSELEVSTGENYLKTSRSDLSIVEKKRDSELAVKQLAIDLAKLALQSWNEGEVVAKRLDLTLAVQTAEKNYQRLLKKYDSSVELYEQKFLSKDELDQDEIAVLNADASLKKAKLNVEVYENYTHQQEKEKKESDLQQAKDEHERAVARLSSEIESAKATINSRENQLSAYKEKLNKLRGQLKMCVVTAPASGMVVHATSVGRQREGSESLDVGQNLYRNQLVMTIPDTANMVAKVKVNEALSGLISKGQPAFVRCDALPDSTFEGEVLSVGVLAEGGGWRDPNRRDYTVDIKLINTGGAPLKPSMRCSAGVYVESVEDVLFVPVHAIHRTGGVVWVWAQGDGGFVQQVVEMGRFSDTYAEILVGLEIEDVVLLRDPAPNMVLSRLEDEGVR